MLTFGILPTGDRLDGQEPRLVPYTATALAVRPVFRSAFRLKVVAPERIPAKGPLAVVANHESNLGGFVLISVFTERRLTFLSAAHLFERPAIGRYLRGIGALPVEEDQANVSSFKKVLAILGSGTELRTRSTSRGASSRRYGACTVSCASASGPSAGRSVPAEVSH